MSKMDGMLEIMGCSGESSGLVYERGPRKERDQHRGLSWCRTASFNTPTRSPTNIPTNRSAWLGVLAAASVQNLALIVVAWSPRCHGQGDASGGWRSQPLGCL